MDTFSSHIDGATADAGAGLNASNAHWLASAPPQAPWLHAEVASRLWDRAECIRTPVQRWAELGAVREDGTLQARMAQQHTQAEALRVAWPYRDTAEQAMASSFSVQGLDQDSGQGVDMLWSNLQLHWAPDPAHWLRQWAQWLNPQGYVLFSYFGPDTLASLRSCYQKQGWAPPAQTFVDMHDVGDMLVGAGFADPVVDMEVLRLHYPNVAALRADLRELGRNTAPDRDATTRGRDWLRHWDEVVTQELAGEDGRLYVEFEVVYGHAFYIPRDTSKSSQDAQATHEMQETRIGLDDLRKKLKERGLP